VIPASPVRQVQWARQAQQAPKGPLDLGDPRGRLEILHEVRPPQTTALSMSGEFRPFDWLTTGSWPLSKLRCRNITVVAFCFYTVAEMLGTVLDLAAITIRQTRD
jgi:hypothetical protein